jgi:hypothetical protein
MYLLAFTPSCLLLMLLVLLARRHAYEEVPYFFAYAAFAVCADVARLLAHGHARAYYAAYWITEGGYDLLGVLVMNEVLRSVLGNLIRPRRAHIIFLLILTGGFVLSVARARVAPVQFTHPIAYYVLVGEIAVRFVQVFIFAGLVSLVPLIGLRWRQHPFGIATGFGLYATVSLLISTKLSDFGTRFMFLWNATSLVAYSVAVLIWIWFFSAPQKMETPRTEFSTPSPTDLKQYKNALRRMR